MTVKGVFSSWVTVAINSFCWVAKVWAFIMLWYKNQTAVTKMMSVPKVKIIVTKAVFLAAIRTEPASWIISNCSPVPLSFGNEAIFSPFVFDLRWDLRPRITFSSESCTISKGICQDGVRGI